MSVGDVHIADPFGWPLCGSNGPLRGYSATSPPCRDCDDLDKRSRIAPAPQALVPAPAGALPQALAPAPGKSRIKTFWCEPIERGEESLRRYTYGIAMGSKPARPCAATGSGCGAIVVLGEVDYPISPDGIEWGWGKDDLDHVDPRWPQVCEHCGQPFPDDGEWQHNIERLYRRVDGTDTFTQRKMPAGASYDAVWLHAFSDNAFKGPDGIALTIILPDGTEWHVDSEANNCTRKGDRTHKCWVREGDPRAGNVTAGKNGNTCSAGAGSIASPRYHGFLRNGWLEEC